MSPCVFKGLWSGRDRALLPRGFQTNNPCWSLGDAGGSQQAPTGREESLVALLGAKGKID